MPFTYLEIYMSIFHNIIPDVDRISRNFNLIKPFPLLQEQFSSQ